MQVIAARTILAQVLVQHAFCGQACSMQQGSASIRTGQHAAPTVTFSGIWSHSLEEQNMHM